MTAVTRPGRPRPPAAVAMLAVAFGVVGLGLALRSLAFAVTLSTPVPMLDQWEFVGDLMRFDAGRYGWTDLFAQHNEHRIFTSRLSFFLDYALFHLDNLSVVLTNYLVMALLAGVLAGLAARGRSALAGAMAFIGALAALWSMAGWINLGWAFQLQWAYVHVFPTLAILCFVLAARRTGTRAWAPWTAACLCDFLASFSMASGLCTVFAVIAVAVFVRAPWRLLAAFCLWHLFVVGLFLWGYDPPHQDLVLDPVRILRYVAPFLGTALPISKRACILLGDAGLGVLAFALAAAARAAVSGRHRLDAALAVLLGVAIFCLAEGIAAAVGRAGLPDSTGFALRYGTPSEVFWTALGLAAWRALALGGRDGAARGCAAVAICGVLASNTVGDTARIWREWSAKADNVGFNLIAGATSGEPGTLFYPRPQLIQDRIAFVRDHQLGPFAAQESRFRAPLNALGQDPPADPPACVGVEDIGTVDAETQLHVRGWAMTPGRPVSPAWVVAYLGPRLVGYARTWQYRIDRARLSGRSLVIGYDSWFRLPAGASADQVALVMVFPGGSMPPCRVSRPAGASGPAVQG